MEAELVYVKLQPGGYEEGHVKLRFTYHLRAIRGMAGAVSFGWRECSGPVNSDEQVPESIAFIMEPMGLEVGYHRRERTQEWQYENTRECLAMGTPEGVSCFGDSSSLQATEWLEQWEALGRDEDWMRQQLLDYYNAVFYPTSDPTIEDMGFSEVMHKIMGRLA